MRCNAFKTNAGENFIHLLSCSHTQNFLITISLQPDGSKLRLFDLTESIVWSKYRSTKDLGIQVLGMISLY